MAMYAFIYMDARWWRRRRRWGRQRRRSQLCFVVSLIFDSFKKEMFSQRVMQTFVCMFVDQQRLRDQHGGLTSHRNSKWPIIEWGDSARVFNMIYLLLSFFFVCACEGVVQQYTRCTCIRVCACVNSFNERCQRLFEIFVSLPHKAIHVIQHILQ